ncbi:MAG: tRNA pseudouridine(38-40) synthase TruA [Eubacterium sp.]|nr:tRNA pseudouridine(38-40) synthase TruA [Eubacterium sp.]MCM1213495.1 tRNA pseudouridine(38-40) synthase TruA [Lachnospiraceae bacterium]MCM1305018.1 tRNA pseudouridine(38-40) synthase TruA [Butyrivibrio sp.]MCM1344099.1 tRNA pseudouridine(38-40) synthase TruA [Muribaculaceae bacterium]MCM1240895.1 tRNA pseudouridine(38-40) synthase TruA [Lachnospiraceae bacterium]
MKNYKMLIEYDGSRYYGWQRQPDHETIQGKLEKVLSLMCQTEVEVIGAGRTDAGVHARGMVANAHMDTGFSEEEIRAYLNRYLPGDIAVKEVREASPRFHARYNALGKTYRYTCYDGSVKSVFDRKYVAHLEEKPDIAKMRLAAELLKGTHDFRNFCVNPRMKKSTVRYVDRIDIVRKGDHIIFTFHGNGFLQNMVRIMVGVLLEAGCDRLTCEQIRDVLEAKDRQKAGPTAPAQGLCLMSVDY